MARPAFFVAAALLLLHAACTAAEHSNSTGNTTEPLKNFNISGVASYAVDRLTQVMSTMKNWGEEKISVLAPLRDKAWSVISFSLKSNKTLNFKNPEDWISGNIRVTSSWNPRLPLDGLGGILGIPQSRKLLVLSRRQGGVHKWKDYEELKFKKCPVSLYVIDNRPARGANYEVIYSPQNQFAFLAYTTKYLGISMIGCRGLLENQGHLEQITGSGYHILTDNTTNEVYPIMHITIDRLRITTKCQILICGAKRFPSSSPHEVKELELEMTKIVIDPAQASQFGRRLLSSQPIAATPCNTGSRIISVVKYLTHTKERPVAGPYASFCNGTKGKDSYVPETLGCYQVARKVSKVQCPTVESLVQLPNGECSVTSTDTGCDKGLLCFFVEVSGKGVVRVDSDQTHETEDCTHSCSFSVRGTEAFVTCPSGTKHKIVSTRYNPSCMLHEYGKVPRWVCRMTFRPQVAYALVLWYILGYLAVRIAFYLLWGLIFIFAKSLKFIRVRVDSNRGVCDYCGDWVDTGFHYQRHDRCRNGKCPFCDLTGSQAKITEHVKTCPCKRKCLQEDSEVATVRYVPILLRKLLVLLSGFNKFASKGAWLVVCVVLLYMLVHPVSALKQTTKDQDLWEEEASFLDFCLPGCQLTEDSCICSSQPPRLGRSLLSVPQNDSHHGSERGARGGRSRSGSDRQGKRRKIIDISASWGTVHIDSSYRPSYSGNHIALTWSDNYVSETHVTVTGKSQAILKLEPRTGFMWEVGSVKSHEKKRIFLSVLDFTQEYATKFLYATGDREVGNWMHGVCTGACPEQCGCQSPLCHFANHEGFTNWRCNPTWCWSIGSGCACCAVAVKELFKDWFVTKWETEYIGTEVIACLEMVEERVCGKVTSGTILQLGPVSVQFSDVTGVTKHLPKTLGIFHKNNKHTDFDISAPIRLVDGRAMCDVQSCTHGPVGDLQVYDLNSLVSHDHINLNSAEGVEYTKRHAWMSWAGTNSYYTCSPGHWPTCHQENVVEHNTAAFQNLWNNKNLGNDFMFHQEAVNLSTPKPTLSLKGRPSWGGGQITALLNVNGLNLVASKIKPEGLAISVSGCTGCFGCTTGFTCHLRVSLLHPEEYTVHIESLSPDVIATSASILASSTSAKSVEMKFFAAVQVNSFCVRVKEAEPGDNSAKTCTNMVLDGPPSVVLENRGTLLSSSNATCTSGFWDCMGSNANSLWSGLTGLLGSVFGNWIGGIVVFILFILVIAALILIGPSIMKIFGRLVCRSRGRNILRKADVMEMIKKEYMQAMSDLKAVENKDQETKALISKLSKKA